MHSVVKDRWLKRPDKAWLLIIFLILGLILGISLSLLGATGLYVALGSIFLLFAMTSLQSPMLALYGIIVVSASASVFRAAVIPIGNTQMTLSGLVWILFAILIVFALLIRLEKVRIPPHIWPFLAFLAWVMFRWILEPTGFVGLKDVLWYSMPVLVGLYVPLALGKSEDKIQSRVRSLEKAVLYTVFIPAALYILAFSTGLAEMTSRGAKGLLIGVSRATPQYLLIVLSVALANWRYGPFPRQGRFTSLMAVGTIWFTLARTASLLALGMTAIHRVNPRRTWQILAAGVAAIIVAYVAVTQIPVLQQRFFFWGKEGISVSKGFSGVKMMGRDFFWPYTYSSALEKPLIGQGLGAARRRLANAVTFRKDVSEYHPHNEYLQAFHDLGIIGLVLMVTAWIFLLMHFWTKWKSAKSPHLAKWSMAATLCAVVVLIASVTDNTMHYPNVIIPTMIIAGFAERMNKTRDI